MCYENISFFQSYFQSIKTNYCRCWNLKPKEKMLEYLSRSGSICEERKELMFRVQMTLCQKVLIGNGLKGHGEKAGKWG